MIFDFVWSALTCQRFGTRRLVAARLVLSKGGRDKSRSMKAVTSYRTPYFALLVWSALTCQRFGMRRLVAAGIDTSKWPRQVASFKSGNKLPHSTKIPFNLRADPFPYRHRDTIPDHSIRVVVASRESERVRDSLQPGVFSNGVRPRAARKPSIGNQSRAQVFGVVRNTGGCDVPAFRIADNRPVSICAGEAPANIVRDVRRRLRFEYLC